MSRSTCVVSRDKDDGLPKQTSDIREKAILDLILETFQH